MLSKIVEYKTLELDDRKRKTPLLDLQKRMQDIEKPREFIKNFSDGDLNIIAEFKRASPSRGMIRAGAKPKEIARIYEDNGAKSISVLTDEHFFQGSLQDILAVKQTVSLPVLRKDFTLHEYHIFEARAHEADAILLIAAILDDFQIKDYLDLANDLEMTTLVEIHDQDELNRILNLNLKLKQNLLGINNRNLKTFNTNIQVTLDLLPMIPETIKVISESGLKTHDNLLKLKENNVYGFLIGETLMNTDNIGRLLRELCQFK